MTPERVIQILSEGALNFRHNEQRITAYLYRSREWMRAERKAEVREAEKIYAGLAEACEAIAAQLAERFQ